MSRMPPSRRNPLSRRSFLRAALGAGAMSVAAQGAEAGGKKVGDSTEVLDVGIIGVGARGVELLDEIAALAGAGVKVRIVAVCDVYEPRRRAAGARAKIPENAAYRDYRKLLAHPGLDAVIIATPDHWHAAMTKAALQAGEAVYCESPFTYDLEEARELVELVGDPNEDTKKVKHVVQIGITALTEARWRKVFAWIEEGKIGTLLMTTSHASFNSKEGLWNTPVVPLAELKKTLDWEAFGGSAVKKHPTLSVTTDRFFRWRKHWEFSGGMAMQLLYDRLAEVVMAVDGPEPQFPRKVSTFGGIYHFYDRAVPDTLSIHVDYPSNHTVVLTACAANDVGLVKAIRGHDGTIFFDGDGLLLQCQEQVVGTKPSLRYKEEPKNGTAELLKNFFQCARTRTEPLCPPRFAFRIQVAMWMAVVSYCTGNTVYWHRRKERLEICNEPVPPGHPCID